MKKTTKPIPTAYLSGEGGTVTIIGQSYPVVHWSGIQYDGRHVEGSISIATSDANAIPARSAFMMTSELPTGEAVTVWGEVEGSYWTKGGQAVVVTFGQGVGFVGAEECSTTL